MLKAAKNVIWNVAEGIGYIRLNRPEKGNALNRAAGADFAEAVDAVLGSDVNVILLSGTGRTFCGGGDIAEFGENIDGLHDYIDDVLRLMVPPILKLVTVPVPIVSALNGSVGGAGIGIALCADIVLAASSMKMYGGYSALGLSPDIGASWFVERRVGVARAKELFLLNPSLTAQQCLDWGLINAIFPDDELMVEAERLVLKLSTGAAQAFGRVKHLIDCASYHTLEQQMSLETKFILACAGSTEARDGIKGYINRRSSPFVGR